MPMPIIPVPQFPDVPDVPGVPALVRDVAAKFVGTGNAIITAEGLGLFNQRAKGPGVKRPATVTQVWGFFDMTGQPVVLQDSILSVDFAAENQVADHPVETGGFASYNKVQAANRVMLAVTKGGAEAERAKFQQRLDKARTTLDLFAVITPDVTLTNLTIERITYGRRQSNGANLLVVDIVLREVRIANTGSAMKFGANTVKAPDAAAPVQVGTVYPQAPTAAILAAATLSLDPIIASAAKRAVANITSSGG